MSIFVFHVCRINIKKLILQAQAKFDLKQAVVALDWIKDVTNLNLDPPNNTEKGIKDQFDFADVLKDGVALCT